VNGNGTRLERVRKKKREEKEIVRRRYALDGRQVSKNKKETERVVNLFSEDKKIEVR
jgi:hypothetical protein